MKKVILISTLVVASLTLFACEAPGPRYKNVKSFSEGLAPVEAKNGKWGYINEKQTWVIPPRYQDAREFNMGKAAVKHNGKWGFINKRGDWQ